MWRRARPIRRLGAWLGRSTWLQVLIGALGAAYIWLVLKTLRWRREGEEHATAALARGGVIAAVWHGRLMLSPGLAPPGRRSLAMISHSRDGDVIARIVGWWGIGTVRGSTYDRAKRRDKGGARALGGAIRALREGCALTVTPDGPRGPRRRAQPGAAQLALETGATLLPIAFSASPALRLKSWDHFLVPLPFARGALVFGAPVEPARSGDEDAGAMAARLERALSATTDRADDLAGRPREAPATDAPLSGAKSPDDPAER